MNKQKGYSFYRLHKMNVDIFYRLGIFMAKGISVASGGEKERC